MIVQRISEGGELPLEILVRVETPEELADLYGRINAFAPAVFSQSLDHEDVLGDPTWCESEELLELLDGFIQAWVREVR